MKSSISTIGPLTDLTCEELEIIKLYEEYLKESIHKNRGLFIKLPEIGSFKFVFSNLSKCIKKIILTSWKKQGFKDGRNGNTRELQDMWIALLEKNFNQAKEFKESIGMSDEVFYKLHLIEQGNYKKLEEAFKDNSIKELMASRKSGRFCTIGITLEDIEYLKGLKQELPEMSEYIDNTISLIITQYRIIFFGSNKYSHRRVLSKKLNLPNWLKAYETKTIDEE